MPPPCASAATANVTIPKRAVKKRMVKFESRIEDGDK